MRSTIYLLCGICILVVLVFVSISINAPLFVFIAEVFLVVLLDVWLIAIQFRKKKDR